MDDELPKIFCGFVDSFLFGDEVTEDEFENYQSKMRKSYPKMKIEEDLWVETKNEFEYKFHRK